MSDNTKKCKRCGKSFEGDSDTCPDCRRNDFRHIRFDSKPIDIGEFMRKAQRDEYISQGGDPSKFNPW